MPGEVAPCDAGFIPLSGRQVARWLKNRAERCGQDPALVEKLLLLMAQASRLECLGLQQRVRCAYAPFDPDAIVPQPAVGPARRQALAEEFMGSMRLILARGNYHRLSDEQLREAANIASRWGLLLDVDFRAFRHMEVYVRGHATCYRPVPLAPFFSRPKLQPLAMYQRVVIVFQVAPEAADRTGLDPNAIYLKLFKDVPTADVDMLLPCTRIRIRWLDRCRIAFPTLTGLAVAAYKVVKAGVLLAFTGLYNLLILLGIVGTTVGYGAKSFFSYLRTRDKYHLNLTRSLYYQSLDSNGGVILRLLDEAAEQEFLEGAVAWVVLSVLAGGKPQAVAQADERAEALLRDLGITVDFQIDDALQKLQRWGVARPMAANTWQALPAPAAMAALQSLIGRLLDVNGRHF